MRRNLQRVRRFAQLARRAVRVAIANGPVEAAARTIRYVACRCGLMSRREYETALAQLAQCRQSVATLQQIAAEAQQSVAAAQEFAVDVQRSVATVQQFAVDVQHLVYAVHETVVSNHQLVAAVSPQVESLEQRITGIEQRHAQVSQSLRWLGERAAALGESHASLAELQQSGPLVSVVLPVWNRRSELGAAIDSVIKQTYGHWELLIVDDGSTDGSVKVVAERLEDARIRLLTQDHRGVSAARNLALRHARGEIVAYLDSDNEWFPQYLADVVSAFGKDPELDCAYAAQFVEEDESSNRCHIRCVRFDRDTYVESGGIDLNVFAHRRRLVQRYGEFDEGLCRLVDWDLIARYTRHRDPAFIPTIGGRYRDFGPKRISNSGNYWHSHYQMRRKHERPVDRELRVLYVVWDYPQLTETYIRWEITCMKRWGVHVEVWSELDKTAAPYPADVPVHYGSLDDAIKQVKPHVAHVHWLDMAERYHEQIGRAGLQMTVRGHGFEFDAVKLGPLLQNQGVQRIYVFPHFEPAANGEPRIRPMNAAFNPDLYYPPADKDPTLVVRTASGKPAKDLKTFIDVARQCPRHRFILALGVLNQLEHYVEEIQQYNRRAGSPVEIRINVATEEAAALVREAGIYLHTYGDDEPFGMPISIAEAMATGSLTLVRNLPGAAEYVGSVGGVYTSVDHAASLIRQSARWYDEQWRDRRRQTVEYAYQHFLDISVLRPILDDWLQIAESGMEAPSLIEELQDGQLQPVLRYLFDETELALSSNFGRTYLSHIAGTCRRLRDWGAEADVCRAGVFHSVYVDSRVDPTPQNRARIGKLVGERAEHLAYAFTACTVTDLDRVLDDDGTCEILDQFGSGLQLTSADIDDLCLIHLAEWSEKMRRCPEGPLQPGIYRRMAERLNGRVRACVGLEAQGTGVEWPLQPAA